jgi:hypothetical protein
MADEDPESTEVDPSLFEDVKYYISGTLDDKVNFPLNRIRISG